MNMYKPFAYVAAALYAAVVVSAAEPQKPADNTKPTGIQDIVHSTSQADSGKKTFIQALYDLYTLAKKFNISAQNYNTAVSRYFLANSASMNSFGESLQRESELKTLAAKEGRELTDKEREEIRGLADKTKRLDEAARTAFEELTAKHVKIHQK